jgi:hypothetical protein
MGFAQDRCAGSAILGSLCPSRLGTLCARLGIGVILGGSAAARRVMFAGGFDSGSLDMRRAVTTILPTSLVLAAVAALSGPLGAAEPPALRRPAPAAAAPMAVMDRPPTTLDAACLTPAELVAATGDRDVRRLSGPLADPGLCLGVVRVDGATAPWTLLVVAHRSRSGPRWVLPHDDEQSAFDAGVEAVRRFGGVLVAVESGETRLWRGIDPNRIFGSGTCGRGPADPAYTAAVLARLDRRFPIVALHSNERRGGTISMARPYRGAEAFRAAAGAPRRLGAPRRDDDTMVILAGRSPPTEPSARASIAWFTERGVNVLYETVRPGRSDCSLSNHAALAGLPRTLTVEVAHGDTASARALVDLVMQFAGIAPR